MRLLTLLFLTFAPLLFGEGPEFDVASVKIAAPLANGVLLFGGPARGGPGTEDPTHITWDSATLKSVLMVAFNMKAYQVIGPDTLESQRYNFAIAVPEGATKQDVALMWRNLLVSRLGLKYRIEQKEFTVEDLVVGPRGHKLVASTIPADGQPTGPPAMGNDGKPATPGMYLTIHSDPKGVVAHSMAKNQPISALTEMLSNQVGHPVMDKTGLTGKYDFDVEFAPTNIRFAGGTFGGGRGGPETAGGAPELGLELHEAFQQTLGLRLVGGKGKLDTVVVEKVDRVPSEN